MGRVVTSKQITVQERQTIFDIAIQEYGSVEGVFLLWKDNPDKIPSFTQQLVPGTKLNIISPPINQAIVGYYEKNTIKPASGLPAGDYNNDFSEDYLI